jgi:D-lactate dehydrogenase
MKVLVFSTKDFELEALKKANKGRHKITFVSEALDSTTAVLAAGYEAISIFSGDDASLVVLEILKDLGVKYITLRSAGFNNVSLKSANRIGLKVANAPDYSPHAISEHTICLLLALNRKLITAHEQVKHYNFLQNNLMGTNLNRKTVGVVGTGRIGSLLVRLFHAFGCEVLAHDLETNHYLENQFDVEYMKLKELCRKADIISINIPLNHETHYLFDKPLFDSMKKGVVLVNTARGAIVRTSALLQALKNGTVAGYATDVYETEKGIFFKDNSAHGIMDDKLKELISLPNVLLTPHQAFVTKEAISNIAETTLHNLNCWQDNISSENELGYETEVL